MNQICGILSIIQYEIARSASLILVNLGNLIPKVFVYYAISVCYRKGLKKVKKGQSEFIHEILLLPKKMVEYKIPHHRSARNTAAVTTGRPFVYGFISERWSL